MPQTAVLADGPPLTVQLEPVIHLTREEFFELSRINRDLRIERTATGELVVMPPTGGSTGSRNAELTFQLQGWARENGSGVAFDSSTAFVLANGAIRSPDASWVRKDRLAALSPREKDRLLPLCPDFVVELWSPSDSLKMLEGKMEEYRENGAELGFLIDPGQKTVQVFRPGREVEVLAAPERLSGEPVLTGFELDLGRIWSPGW